MFLPFLDFSKLFGDLPRVRQKVDDQEIEEAPRYNLRSSVTKDVNYIVIFDKNPLKLCLNSSSLIPNKTSQISLK